MKIYIDVFIMGVTLGWGPCLSFCAPILLPYISGTQKDWFSGLKVSLTFSFARIIPYIILSIISATIGSYLIERFYRTQGGLIGYIIAGCFILLLGILILLGKSERLHLCLPFKKFRKEGIKEMALLGLLVGFAPCLPLLGLLAYIAFHAQGFLQGLFLGLSFGAGTLVSPLILFGPIAGGIASFLIAKPLIYKIFTRSCGAVLVYFGGWMVSEAISYGAFDLG